MGLTEGGRFGADLDSSAESDRWAQQPVRADAGKPAGLAWSWLPLHLSERKLLLVLGDAFCWAAVTLLQAGILHRRGLPPALTIGLVVGTATWLLAAWVTGGYDVDTASRTSRILPVILKSAVAVDLTVLIYALLFSRGAVGRVEWAFTLLTVCELLALWRISYLTIFTLPRFSRKLLFIGADPLNQTIAAGLRDDWRSPFAIAGFLGVPNDPQPLGPATLNVPQSKCFAAGQLGDNAPATARDLGASEIIAGADALADSASLAQLIACANSGIKVTTAPAMYEELYKRIPVDRVDQRFIIDLARGAFTDRTHVGLKRITDILLATVGAAGFLLTGPVIALALLIEDGPPVLYRQARVGLRGRTFYITKFRTMRKDAEPEQRPIWAAKGDSRVTRVGRFLRATRLDELPQVFNIISGEMSIVGPRPERPEFVSELSARLAFYDTRHAVKPGLTGWAQVCMGYAASVDDARAKLEFDLYYVRRQSLLLDALIILRTLGTVVRFRGR